MYSCAGAVSLPGLFAFYPRAELRHLWESESSAPAAREAVRLEYIHVCVVRAMFFQTWCRLSVIYFTSPKNEKSNDFQPKFAVFCEFPLCPGFASGCNPRQCGLRRIPVVSPFCFFFLLLFFLVFCSFLPDVQLCSPRSSMKSNWLCNEEEKLRRKQRRTGLMDKEEKPFCGGVSGTGRGLRCVSGFSLRVQKWCISLNYFPALRSSSHHHKKLLWWIIQYLKMSPPALCC